MPLFSDARAQVRLVAAHAGAHRVARAARRIDHDVGGQVLRALRREAELRSRLRHVLLVGLRGRILLRDDLVELGFGVRGCAGRKPLYQMSNGSSGRPRRASISFATRGTSGEVSTCSSIACTRASGISRLRRSGGRSASARSASTGRACSPRESLQQHRVARVAARARALGVRRRRCHASESFDAAGCHRVREWIPVDVRVVDHHVRESSASTMRSITCWIIRCLARPFAASA